MSRLPMLSGREAWRTQGGAAATPSQAQSAIAVGLADAHRRRGRDTGMLYFLRQVGAKALTMVCFKDGEMSCLKDRAPSDRIHRADRENILSLQ
jgi:hypothetical protein